MGGSDEARPVRPSVGRGEVWLTLFVSGASELSTRAISDARDLCEAHLAGTFRLSVVDIEDGSSAAIDQPVFATPTLVRTRPRPQLRVMGDLSDAARVLPALGLGTGAM